MQAMDTEAGSQPCQSHARLACRNIMCMFVVALVGGVCGAAVTVLTLPELIAKDPLAQRADQDFWFRLQDIDLKPSSSSLLLTNLNASSQLQPIDPSLHGPLLPLVNAVQYTGLQGVWFPAWNSFTKGQHLASKDPYHLDREEAGAINLYTAETPLYPQMNTRLRQAHETGSIATAMPFVPFWRLMWNARLKLPKSPRTVFRGIKGKDLRADYAKGKRIMWPAFSSCTTDLSFLQSETFLGKQGIRTLFVIDMLTGVQIVQYSDFSNEAEVLLYPGTWFDVLGTVDLGNNLFQVHMKEAGSSSMSQASNLSE
eukprot:TRINITY_DN110929_c0_g1_i1.p1 TRINITY_DN110929_c0_g1~~TRINITY_DN110929_c0_g1_i1.p1  ORF type:complete len:312 (+),score=38.98 TRINITY_DN110929_c0_g1_i1:61-996(+)